MSPEPEPGPDELIRQAFIEMFGIRGELLLEARKLAEAGDPELREARNMLLAARVLLDQMTTAAQETYNIPDVSHFELRAAATAEASAHIRAVALEDKMVAIVARRHRLALQQQEQEQEHQGEGKRDADA